MEYLEIEFANGLRSSINIIPEGVDGEHLTRGGDLTAFRMSGIQSQEIKNKKAMILLPYPNEFKYYNTYTNIEDLAAVFTASDPEMDVDLQVGEDVTLQDLDRLGDCGLIILDMHGTKNGFSLAYIKEKFNPNDNWLVDNEIDDVFNAQNLPPDKLENGQIEIGIHIFKSGAQTWFSFNVLITEDYIRQLNVDLSDAVVFGNYCYSGHTADGPSANNMPEAWRSKGVAT